ncbi:MAG: hypothetical protein WA885_11100 [Phormidesmis sp.]
MNRYLTRLSQLTLLVAFFTIKSTVSCAASLPTAKGDDHSRLVTSLSNNLLAENAIALTQNETLESNSSQRFSTLN